MNGLVILFIIAGFLFFLMIKAMKNRAGESHDSHDSSNPYVDLNEGLHPAERSTEPAAQSEQPTRDQSTSTTAGQNLATAPRPYSRTFGHSIGFVLAVILAAARIGINLSGQAANVTVWEHLWMQIQTVPFWNLCIFIVDFILLFGFLNPGNFIIVPAYHVAKLYQTIGTSGSAQIITYKPYETGWKPMMLLPGFNLRNYVPFSFIFNITLFPWVRVPSSGLAYIKSNTGAALPTGRRTAKALLLECYQNVLKFRKGEGQLDIQRTILTPGFFGPIDPIAFTVVTSAPNGIYGLLMDEGLNTKRTQGLLAWKDIPGFESRKESDFKPTAIPDGKQGLVTIRDGVPLSKGEIVHRFGGFKDIEDHLKKKKGPIDSYHEIKELLDKKGHLEDEQRKLERQVELRDKVVERQTRLEAELSELESGSDEERAKRTKDQARQIKWLKEQIDSAIEKLAWIEKQPEKIKGLEQEIAKLEVEKHIENLEKELQDPDGKLSLNDKRIIEGLQRLDYRASGDIFKTGRKFEMMLCQELLTKALASQLEKHNSYQDLDKFYNEGGAYLGEGSKPYEGGKQGPQWDTLPPGQYNLNRFVVDVEEKDLVVVREGTVRVIRAGVGLDSVDITHRRFSFGAIVRPGYKGIWLAPLTTGTYLFNTKYLKPITVPTALVTYFWGEGTKALTLEGEDGKPGKPLDQELKAIVTITKDGVKDVLLDVNMQAIFPAESAAILIASFGSVEDLVNGFIASKLSGLTVDVVRTRAIDELIGNQKEVEEEIIDLLKAEFAPFEIQVQAILILKISGADEYLDMRQRRVLALKEKEAVDAEAMVEAARIEQFKKAGEAQRAFEVAVSVSDKEIAKNTSEMVKTLFAETTTITGEAGDTLRNGLAEGVKLHYTKRAVGEKAAAAIQIVDKLTKSEQPFVSSVALGDKGSIADALMGTLLKDGGVTDALEVFKKTIEEKKHGGKKAEAKHTTESAPQP